MDGGQRVTLPRVKETGRHPRLLPWATEDGKTCVLSTDDDGGFLSRLADNFEAAQLSVAEDILQRAVPVLEDPMAPHVEVRYAAVRLTECLRDVLRIAESRGLRLPPTDVGEEGEDVSEGPA
ncbi:hypothetical protein DMH26_28955 [Streptomyces sp. WAC 05379]|nr:hypothetical protein DMH26_28955 [Streptomyces sp. WAC 05379]